MRLGTGQGRESGTEPPTAPRTPEQVELSRATWRLGLLSAVVVLAAVLGVAGVALVGATHALAVEADSRRQQAARSIDDVHDASADLWVTVLDLEHGQQESSADLPDGLPDTAALAGARTSGGEVESTVTTPLGRVAVLTVFRDRRVVQVAVDPTQNREISERIVAVVLLAGGVGVVVAGVAGAWLGRRAVQPLADSLARQRRFVSDASHELRTPLTLLSTRVQLLGRHLDAQVSDLPTAVRDDVRGLYGDAAALAGVFDDLLLAADDRSVRPDPVDVAATARTVVAAAAAAAAAKHRTLTLTGDPTAVALASQSPVRRALTALVDNALEHAESAVVVDVVNDGGVVRVQVVDDGPGIAEGARVFERFASGGSGSDGRKHYGLGLALVAEIAGKYHGRVLAGARTDRGRGAQLTFELPAVR
ncbi:MAG: HAMP domain-containing histidine kinase [Actinobacteria bacterium]|nr:HAMP domain-containing histidine kinase [Actinomycetota bacterium]